MPSPRDVAPHEAAPKPVTVRTLKRMKEQGERITMLTAYDAMFARLLDAAGIDVLLVGDSLGMVVQGHTSTLSVTVEHMAYHVAAVARGTKRAHIIGDMPFMSWQVSPEAALQNAAVLMRAGAHAVKLEGGTDAAPTISRIVHAGIPVMGHIGLLPQSMHAQGGFVVQGRTAEGEERLLADARAVEAAGAYAVVLEGIPAALAARITAALTIPTIGIGAGNDVDGQVLVLYDLLGLDARFTPKFARKFVDGAKLIGDAAREYTQDVRSGAFPAEQHRF